MKKGWEIKKLEDLCDFGNGLWTGKKPPFVEVGVIRNTNFTKEGELDDSDIVFLNVEKSQFVKRKLEFGDIILEKSGGGPKQPVGRVILFNRHDGEFSYSNFTSVIRIRNRRELNFSYLHKYLFYFYITGSTENMQSHSTGIRNLKFDEYKQMEVPLPPFPEQQRIVTILDEALSSIAKAKENTEKNLQNAKNLFRSYLMNVFAIPGDNWKEMKLGKVMQLEYGKPLDKANRVPDGIYPVYGANGEKDRTNNFYFNKPSIIIGRKGSAGEINLTENFFWPLDVTYFATFDSTKYDLLFLFYLLKCLSLPKLAKGVKPGINRNEVYNIDVNMPSLTVQRLIVTKLDALSTETNKLEAIYINKLVDLEELKKSILQKAFNGEL